MRYVRNALNEAMSYALMYAGAGNAADSCAAKLADSAAVCAACAVPCSGDDAGACMPPHVACNMTSVLWVLPMHPCQRCLIVDDGLESTEAGMPPRQLLFYTSRFGHLIKFRAVEPAGRGFSVGARLGYQHWRGAAPRVLGGCKRRRLVPVQARRAASMWLSWHFTMFSIKIFKM